MVSHSRRIQLVSLMAGLWLLGSGYALYSLQTADQALFDPRMLSDNDPFSLTAAANEFAALSVDAPGATLIHMLDPSCPCSANATQHLIDIAPTIRAQHVDVVLTSAAGHQRHAESVAERIRSETGLPVWTRILNPTMTMIPSAPAAVILNENKDLVYLGPWAAGGMCVAGIGGFVESALLALASPIQKPVVNRTAWGCYCALADRIQSA